MLNKRTYKLLFDDYYQSLCQYAYSITKDRMEAEDAVQDVFVHLWKKRKDTKILNNPKSYLISSVRNKIFEKMRKSKISIVADTDIYNLNYVATDNIEAKIEQLRLADEINASIRQLPSRCGAIFALSKIEGFSNKEVAEKLGISIKTVENQMTKAYKLLRELLKDLI